MLLRRLPEIFVAAAITVAGLAVAVTEARALVSGHTAGAGRNSTIPLPGLAAESRINALLHCDRAMAEPGFGLQSTLSRRQTAGICADLATSVHEDAPSHGFAHLIAASAADALVQPGRMADHLAASQSYAAHEGWLAERRFLLLRAADPVLRDRLLPADIAVLLTTQSGARLLAGTLATPSRLRDLVLAQADNASPADRRRLLNLVRQGPGGA